VRLPSIPTAARWAIDANDNIYRLSGNVSIGVSTPNGKLTVDGIVSLIKSAAPSATSGYGKIYIGDDNNLHLVVEDGYDVPGKQSILLGCPS